MSNDVILSLTDRFPSTERSSPTLKLEDMVAPLSKNALVLTVRSSRSGYSNLLFSHALIVDISSDFLEIYVSRSYLETPTLKRYAFFFDGLSSLKVKELMPTYLVFLWSWTTRTSPSQMLMFSTLMQPFFICGSNSMSNTAPFLTSGSCDS